MKFFFQAVRRSYRLSTLAALLLMAGCAEERIRDQSQTDLASGHADKAVVELEGGLKEYPDSLTLRTGLLQARGQAVAQAVADAGALRAAGKLDEAQARLEATLKLDPTNDRLIAQLSALSIERRQRDALVQAQALVAQGSPDAALRLISQALQDNSQNTALLDLRRKLEMDQRQALLQSSQAVLGEKRSISLDFRDANLRSVLDVVSRASGINFVFDRDLHSDTHITVFLKQARVQDALDLITTTNQLAMKIIDSRTVLIYPNTPEKQREYQEQIVRVFYLSNADAKGASAFLRSMLKLREPFVDERSNMLALRDSQENIQLAERLIAMYDSAEPEVVLQMEVLEIDSTRVTDLGIQFPTSFSLTPIAPSTDTNGLTLGNIRSLTRNNIALGLGAVTVNLQREVGDFTTLADPQIRVKNKEKAKVLVGDKIPIVTSTTGTGGFVSDSVSYIDVGLKLDVEPTIYPDDEVSIRVSLEVSTLGSSVKTASGTLAYQIGTRNASTVLRLRDGETQLLAGLISKDESSDSNRIPGLGDLPVVGRLFSSTLTNGDRKELVLAITPHIVRNLHQPSASESELWVGTEASPRLRPVGGLRAQAEPLAASAPNGAAATAPGAAGPVAMADAAVPVIGDGVARAPAMPSGGKLSWAGPHEAHVGDTFELQLNLDAESPLRGLPLEIHYDPKRLQWADASAGDLFRQGGAEISLSKSDDGAGLARVGVIRNQATGAIGKGPAIVVRFKAIAVGDTSIDIGGAQALGLSGPLTAPTIPPTWLVHVGK